MLLEPKDHVFLGVPVTHAGLSKNLEPASHVRVFWFFSGARRQIAGHRQVCSDQEGPGVDFEPRVHCHEDLPMDHGLPGGACDVSQAFCSSSFLRLWR